MDIVDTVYFLTHGLASSRAVLQSGHQIECALIGKTNAIGLVGTLGFDGTSTRVIALTDGHAWKISRPNLASAIRMLPTVADTLRFFSYAQMGYAVHVGVCNAMHTAEHRVARWLTTAADLLGQSEILVAQEEVASSLGLQRSAVNPALQKLKLTKLIGVSRGRIVILDSDRLSRRACECRLTLRRALCLDPGSPV